MKVKLSGNQQDYFLCDPWECETLKFSDASSAAFFLAKFKHDQASMTHMRNFLEKNIFSHDVRKFDDQKVIEVLSQQLVSSALKIVSLRTLIVGLNLPVAVDTTAPKPAQPKEKPLAAQPSKDQEMPAHIAQAEILKQAAAKGKPFCEQ